MWTPTTEYIRDSYDEVNRPFVRYSEEEFDRWPAAHDREVAEKAWDEGFMREQVGQLPYVQGNNCAQD